MVGVGGDTGIKLIKGEREREMFVIWRGAARSRSRTRTRTCRVYLYCYIYDKNIILPNH